MSLLVVQSHLIRMLSKFFVLLVLKLFFLSLRKGLFNIQHEIQNLTKYFFIFFNFNSTVISPLTIEFMSNIKNDFSICLGNFSSFSRIFISFVFGISTLRYYDFINTLGMCEYMWTLGKWKFFLALTTTTSHRQIEMRNMWKLNSHNSRGSVLHFLCEFHKVNCNVLFVRCNIDSHSTCCYCLSLRHKGTEENIKNWSIFRKNKIFYFSVMLTTTQKCSKETKKSNFSIFFSIFFNIPDTWGAPY